MKRVLWLCLLLLAACARPIDPSPGLPISPEEAAERDTEFLGSVGVILGLLTVSLDHNGEVEITVTAPSPRIVTPLGGFGVFAEGSVRFPEKKTLTVATGGQTWIYDLHDEPFTVELQGIDALINGDGTGNIVIQITDARVNTQAEPRVNTGASPRDIPVNRPTLDPQTIELGRSANGNPITATRLGNGSQAVIFVGGFHAGFAPGTVDLAERAIAYFEDNGDEIPADVSLYIIPVANPDSVGRGVETKEGRLNGNDVDINRNWDCTWSNTAQWRNIPINPGSFAFSEPESQALRDFFLSVQPSAVVFWEARGDLVIPGRCGGQFHSRSQSLASVYGVAAGYKYGFITGYTITGDVSDWLDSQGFPAIAILLSGYTATDWQKNLEGMQALLLDAAR
jgi:hypothetical protein